MPIGRKFSGPLLPGTKSVKTVNRRNRGYKRTAYRPTRAIQNYVKQQIHKNIENKYDSLTLLPTQIPAFIGDNSTSANIFPIMPSIGRGTQPNSRVGNKLNPRSLIIKGYVTLDMADNTADYDRICIRLIAGFPKQFPLNAQAQQDIIDNPGANWTNELIDLGGSNGAFDGTLRALQSPVNREIFTVKKQVFMKLSRPRFYDAPLVGNDAYRYSGNSTRFFTMKIRTPKTLLYTDSGTNATNFAPVLCAGYTLLNGATPGTPSAVSPKPLTISFTSRFVYEDA
jgi:hypothetical protein